jgi:predicted enzyme related to lactoylglutathione lyase
MAVQGAGAIVMSTGRPDEMVDFYRALGVPLQMEHHGEGGLHWAAGIGGLHVAVHPVFGEGDAPGYRQAGNTLVGFVVDSVDDAVAAVFALGAAVIQQPTNMPWGRRAIVVDPDGRPVEVVERPTTP